MMFDRPTMSAGAVFVDPGVNVSGHLSHRQEPESRQYRPRRRGCPTSTLSRRLTTNLVGGRLSPLNYGLATEYNDDYAAGSMGGKTDLTTANFNLSGAYRLDSNLELRLRL